MTQEENETLTFLQSTSSDVTNNIIYTRYEYGPYTLRTESYTSISSLSFEDRKDGIWPTLHQETLYKGKSTVAISMLDRIYTTKEVEVLVDKIAHNGGRNE